MHSNHGFGSWLAMKCFPSATQTRPPCASWQSSITGVLKCHDDDDDDDDGDDDDDDDDDGNAIDDDGDDDDADDDGDDDYVRHLLLDRSDQTLVAEHLLAGCANHKD
eukprot:scaffold124919_cov22-Tisochrysis_lutea.AAC.1